MKVWVDLVNSPQVLVLRPIVDILRREGHEVLITTRDFAQTVELANQFGFAHTPIGRHGGNSRVRSMLFNLQRVVELVALVRRHEVDLAVSHNSYSQALAARFLGVPFVTMMDYEHHWGNHLSFRLARRVLVPSAFPDASLEKFGALQKVVRYPGMKEDLYLSNFEPDPSFANTIGLPTDRPIVVARPPGHWAPYYRGDGDLFASFIEHTLADPNAFLVFLPRVESQRSIVDKARSDRVLIPLRALNGPNLLYCADLAVSAGGTMNREAAVLGTPACSLFEGSLGAVDRLLSDEGRLRVIRTADEVKTIPFQKKIRGEKRRTAGPELGHWVTQAILAAAE